MSDLPIDQSWLVIANLSTDLHKKGIQIPKEINSDRFGQVSNRLL